MPRYLETVIAALREITAANIDIPWGKFTYENWKKAAPDARHHPRLFDKWYKRYDEMSFPINIYRGLCIDNPDGTHNLKGLDTQNLGIHWTTEKHQADCIDITDETPDGEYNTYILSGKIDRDDVDWVTTFKHNLDHNFDYELEINPKKGTPIQVSQIQLVEPDGSIGRKVGRSFKGKV